jgi:hypothetical protein
MVRFYLQNTKKILIILVSLLSLTSLKCSKIINLSTKSIEIKDYLNLEFHMAPDSVAVGDTLRIDAIFHNRTDSLVEFYPKAAYYLIKPSQYSNIQSYSLNDTVYLDSVVQIMPLSIFTFSMNIVLKDVIFNEGWNRVHLYYVCGKFNYRLNKDFNPLYGSLQSQEVNLFVKH